MFGKKPFLLRDIPNNAGYEFIGVGKDGSEFDCVVKLVDGMHRAFRKDTDAPCYHELSGWKWRYPK